MLVLAEERQKIDTLLQSWNCSLKYGREYTKCSNRTTGRVRGWGLVELLARAQQPIARPGMFTSAIGLQILH